MLEVSEYAKIRSMEDIKFWATLKRIPQFGTVRFRRLEAHFGKVGNAWQARLAELKAAGIEDRPAREIVVARSRISPDAEIERMTLAGVKPVNWHHPDYPPWLKEIHDPPPGLLLQRHLAAVRRAGGGGCRDSGAHHLWTRGSRRFDRRPGPPRHHHRQRTGPGASTASPIGWPWTPEGEPSPSWPMAWTWSTLGSTLGCSSGSSSRVRWLASTLWGCGRTPAASPGGTG